MAIATEIGIDYGAFLERKRVAAIPVGFGVDEDHINPMLFPFQRDVVRWAAAKGRCAVLLDTGLGKTFVQLEWARLVNERTLIVAPLSVARQTVREATKLGLTVHYTRDGSDLTDGINITNYEMIGHFDAAKFGAVVLDESSILKAISGATRKALTEAFAGVKYRLCCTATPAPNDYTELGNHAHFLGICTTAEMLSMFFVNANKQQAIEYNGRIIEKKGSNKGGTEWRLKHHAESRFFEWLSTWAITMTKPSDLGYSDDGFILPPLNIYPLFLPSDYRPTDELMFTGLHGLANRVDVRRQAMAARLAALRGVVDGSAGQWIIWVGLDEESSAVTTAFSDAVEVKGSDSPESKARAIEAFQDGEYRILVSKGRIAGFGLNLQNAHDMAFFGLNDSWETYYQCIRREWRYGQTEPVNVHLILSEIEDEIYRNVMRKDALAARLRSQLIDAVRDYERGELGMVTHLEQGYEQRDARGQGWRLMLGDSCERLKEIETASVDMSVYSPPFSDLFTYSASDRDLGNSRGTADFFQHYAFIIREVLRVTKPGRLTCVHTSDIPAMASRDGWIGLKDFPGDVIRAYEAEGWTFIGRAFVQKNPQALKDGTPVLTPAGWVPIEQLRVDDLIIGSDGKPTSIIDVPYRGAQPIYRVTFDDGASVECGPEHLWTVRTGAHNTWKPLRTDQIHELGTQAPSGLLRWEIPVAEPIEHPGDVLPLYPRLLGALLADGNWAGQRCVSITKDRELVESLPLPVGHRVTERPGSERAGGRTATYGINGGCWHQNAVLSALRALGLENCRAWEKFIPAEYLTATIAERRELLRGLLDGDGSIQSKGGIWYRTTSEQLVRGVVDLVNSLGGLATARQKDGGRYGDGKRGRPLWEISIRLTGDWCPFTLERKAKHWKNNRRRIHRRILSVGLTGETAPCTCISVAAPDGLYVTDGHVVTHNSQAIRVKSKALLFVQLRKDSADSRPALVDQILLFKAPGENAVPIRPVDNGELDNETWIEWANGIWLGISESNTLSYHNARAAEDEKHICPLQLGTIERCVKLYSNPGELVLSPFAGIGSEGFVAVKNGRRFVGVELKPSYWKTAVSNLEEAERIAHAPSLFDWAAAQ